MCTTKGRAQQPLLRNGESAPCYFLKSACSVNDYLDMIHFGIFSLHVSPCRLLYWFSRPLSARTHYRSTSAHIECYLATKQDGFFNCLIDLNLLYFLQYISLPCSVNKQCIQFLQYAFLGFLRVYSMRPHIDTPKFLLAISPFTSFLLSLYLHYTTTVTACQEENYEVLMKFIHLILHYIMELKICQVLFYESLMKFQISKKGALKAPLP